MIGERRFRPLTRPSVSRCGAAPAGRRPGAIERRESSRLGGHSRAVLSHATRRSAIELRESPRVASAHCHAPRASRSPASSPPTAARDAGAASRSAPRAALPVRPPPVRRTLRDRTPERTAPAMRSAAARGGQLRASTRLARRRCAHAAERRERAASTVEAGSGSRSRASARSWPVSAAPAPDAQHPGKREGDPRRRRRQRRAEAPRFDRGERLPGRIADVVALRGTIDSTRIGSGGRICVWSRPSAFRAALLQVVGDGQRREC